MQTNFESLIKQATYSAKLARLLSEENIGVVFSNDAQTASFSPSTRMLTFPYNTAMMDPDIHELFMFHEISHALHLPVDSVERVRDAKVKHDMFNIVIDIRDERLIKEKYPGSLKSFRDGYKKLYDQQFFGETPKLTLQSFPSRLNVYAKVGMVVGASIKMLPKELDFYNRCMCAVTLEECIELARELETMENQYSVDIRKLARGVRTGEDDDEFSELIAQMLEEIEKESDEPLSKYETEEELLKRLQDARELDSQESLSDAFKRSCLQNASVYVYGNYTKSDIKFNIIDWKSYYKFLTVSHTCSNDDTEAIREMRRNMSSSVDSMVRIFESKKAAVRRANAKVSDTGLIDISRAYRYKFDDKIFGTSINIPNAKNHGYILLVDFSGSMSNSMHSVFEQIAVTVEFFRRINVKYKVIAFGAETSRELQLLAGLKQYDSNTTTGLPISVYGNSYLTEFMSSEQTLAEHNMCMHGMFSHIGYSLGYTPTGASMLHIEHVAREFFNAHKIDKRNLIVLTDGDPSDVYTPRGSTIVLTDSITGKNIVANHPMRYEFVNMMGKVLEHRYNIKMSSICITRTLTPGVTSMFTPKVVDDKKGWTARGFVSVNDNYTNNKVYFAKPIGVETDVGNFELDPDKKLTTANVARKLMSSMKSIKKSRAFLNALAEDLS